MSTHRILRTFVYSRYRPGARTIVRHEVAGLVLIEHAILTFYPKLIVELGTGHFGLTAIFHETDPSIEIHTFDSTDHVTRAASMGRGLTNEELLEFRKKVFGDTVHFYIEDVIADENKTVVSLLQRSDKKLLYCDNGDKVRELSLYSKHLNELDILGVHDWGFEGVELKDPKVKSALNGFMPLRINKWFEERNCSTRFFIKALS